MVTDRNMKKEAVASIMPLTIPLAPAISLTDVEQYEFIWPANLDRAELAFVQGYCTAIAGTVTIDVKHAGVSVLSAVITPVANTPVQATLTSTRSTRRIKAGQSVTVHATTNGSGALTNGRLVLGYRGFPAATE